MRKGKGWSLIELLTVIAIIAILVAILFPVFSRAKEAAKKATCLANVSQLSKAMRLYSLDYGDYIHFCRGRPTHIALVPGGYGQGYYFKKSMKNYVPNWDVYFCPSDRYAKKDFCCGGDFGSFSYTADGIGYKGVDQKNDTDPGITRLYSELVRLWGKADMVMNHNELSYRYYGHHGSGEDSPADIDGVYRLFRSSWGAYGYWDVNPSSCDMFQEDLSYHFIGSGGTYGQIYGKVWGFRDGHALFHTYEQHGVNNYGEDPNDLY